jgi:hypothetical protein
LCGGKGEFGFVFQYETRSSTLLARNETSMEAWGSKRTVCTLVKRDGAKSIFALSVAGFAHTNQGQNVRLVGLSGTAAYKKPSRRSGRLRNPVDALNFS